MFRRTRPWLISLLVHALLFIGMWQLRTTAPAKQPTPIEVSLWQAPPPTNTNNLPTPPNEQAQQYKQTPSDKPVQPSSAVTPPATKQPADTATPKTSRATRDTSSPQAIKLAQQKPTPATKATTVTSIEPTPATTSTVTQSRGSLFDRATSYLHTQQQRELTKSELQAVSTRSASAQPRSIAQQHQASLTASGMASNVQDVLDDGRQVVKVGQNCFLASASTDLLKDPLSAKSVACERKASTADQINQLLESRRNRGFTPNEPTGR